MRKPFASRAKFEGSNPSSPAIIRRALRLRSGFRPQAQTAAKRLKFESDGSHQTWSRTRIGCRDLTFNQRERSQCGFKSHRLHQPSPACRASARRATLNAKAVAPSCSSDLQRRSFSGGGSFSEGGLRICQRALRPQYGSRSNPDGSSMPG
jgi:hypothetical protein